jgi:hypothetical protein
MPMPWGVAQHKALPIYFYLLFPCDTQRVFGGHLQSIKNNLLYHCMPGIPFFEVPCHHILLYNITSKCTLKKHYQGFTVKAITVVRVTLSRVP